MAGVGIPESALSSIPGGLCVVGQLISTFLASNAILCIFCSLSFIATSVDVFHERVYKCQIMLGLVSCTSSPFEKVTLAGKLERSKKVILKGLSFNDRNKRFILAMHCMQPPALAVWGEGQIIAELVYLMLRKAIFSRHVK